MPTRFLARMSSHQPCLPPRHGHALLGMRSTGPRSVSPLPWVSAPLHGVSSSSAQAYVLQSQTGKPASLLSKPKLLVAMRGYVCCLLAKMDAVAVIAQHAAHV